MLRKFFVQERSDSKIDIKFAVGYHNGMDKAERLEQLARDVLTRILTPLGYTYSMTATPIPEGGLSLMLESPDARYLIGSGGDRLDDLQYLLNRLIQAEWAEAPRIRLDCDHFRERTEAKLLQRARSRAERVLKTGKPVLMEPLNAYQRRLVHQALADVPGIATSSEDTESRFKRITIAPCD